MSNIGYSEGRTDSLCYLAELEALLRQKDGLEQGATTTSTSSTENHMKAPVPARGPSPSLGSNITTDFPWNNDNMPLSTLSPLVPAHISPVETPPTNGVTANGSSPQLNEVNQVLWSQWPADLPAPDLLQHLFVVLLTLSSAFAKTTRTETRVDVFFAFNPHSHRLFHAPSFMASLALPPYHSDFPYVGILHAICAVGSFYTAAVPPPPLPNFQEAPAGGYSFVTG